MAGLSVNELLFYGGIAVMALSAAGGAGAIALFAVSGRRLRKRLEEEYGRRGSRILAGIRDTYLKKEEDGWHLYGICASAGLGAGPDPHNRKDRTGKPEYYVSEAQMTDNQHGAAACMMAVSEELRR